MNFSEKIKTHYQPIFQKKDKEFNIVSFEALAFSKTKNKLAIKLDIIKKRIYNFNFFVLFLIKFVVI